MPDYLVKTKEYAQLAVLSYAVARAAQGWYTLGRDAKALVAEKIKEKRSR